MLYRNVNLYQNQYGLWAWHDRGSGVKSDQGFSSVDEARFDIDAYLDGEQDLTYLRQLRSVVSLRP